jgi:membrane-bound serine protease (ClpP class)
VAAASDGQVFRIRVDDPITAVTADYIDRALATAEDEGVSAFLIELDTPGGDLASTQEIIQRLLNATVPTIVWVGPPGAQAASAGTFIVLAAHAAGMAPNTTIGAASPVDASGADLPETMQKKVVEDQSATARSLAERRGEKAARWAETAVRDAKSLSSEEALELGLIDAVADDPQTLLGAIDGLEVEVRGEPVALVVAGSAPVDVPMTTGERLLAMLVHPAVALLLITIGVNAILIELSNPGGYVAGVLGVLALTLGFYSLGVLEANLIGLVFIGLAFVLFVLDLKSPTHGLLTAGGVLLFVFGSAVLFSGGYYDVPWGTILAVAVGTGLFFVFALSAVLRAMRRQPVTGTEGLLGQTATVKAALDPEGTVLIQGELWPATLLEGAAEEGATVRVLRREGFHLVVETESAPADGRE